MAADARRPFGRLLTAMVTPFHSDGSLDLAGAAALATYLVDEQRNDGLVISGTTGESPTTSDAEKEALLRAVVEAVGDRAHVLAGVGTNDTAHSVELARSAEKAGATGLLVVSPYYSRPTQAGLLHHFRTVADATGLPMLVYDIPGRSAVTIENDTMCRLAEHERIVGVKDAKVSTSDLTAVLRRVEFAYYVGDDPVLLPMLAVGAVGMVGTSTHFTGPGTQALIAAFEAGDMVEALRLHRQLFPLYSGIFRVPGQGPMLVKAGLTALGLPAGPLRSPLIEATPEQVEQLRRDASDAGVRL